MNLTTIQGLQSEIFVPVTPPPIWAPVTKSLKEMTIAIATAAGVHHKEEKRFNLAGDFTFRKITSDMASTDLMVSHGGYDNGDVNKDINCMFPIDPLKKLAEDGIIKAISPIHFGFMGGGGNQDKFKHETGPEIAALLKESGVDAVLLTAG
jgi:D-proline reductase (dithiol) PrdB